MSNSILVVSNSSVFTCLSALYFEGLDYRFLNVRYPNESLSAPQLFEQHFKEIKLHQYVERGIVQSKHDFIFSEKLAHRFYRLYESQNPSAILFEVVSLKESEFQFLTYIKEFFDTPIILCFQQGDRYNDLKESIADRLDIHAYMNDFSRQSFHSALDTIKSW